MHVAAYNRYLQSIGVYIKLLSITNKQQRKSPGNKKKKKKRNYTGRLLY